MNRSLRIALASVALSSAGAAAAKPPNVVFIAIDDLNTDIGCYGVPQVKTPNIDRLAARGVRFDRAYCQQPLCGPSRASLMTGLRPTTSGFVRLNDSIREKTPDVVTLGEFYQKQGYYVGRVGKIFHYGNPSEIGTDGHDDPQSWTERFNPHGIDRDEEENIIRYPGGTTGRKGGLGISMAWWAPDAPDESFTDGMVASRAIQMIDAHKDGPFFVAAGFFRPHCPYVAPKKYFDLYPIEEITMQPLDEARADLEDVPPMAVQRDTPHWPYFFEGVTVDEARICKRAYYACISFVDAQVGRIVKALEDRGLMENTVIVLWSDHGYFLGEKGLWYKRKNFERSTRAPLVFAGPGVPAGRTVESPVELLDIYPTLAALTGHTPPAAVEGVSLRPVMENPDSSWEKPAVTIVFHGPDAQGFSLRTKRWRYTEWMEGRAGRELYDHDNDPDEVTNLAGNPAYAETIAKLSAQLRPLAILQK